MRLLATLAFACALAGAAHATDLTVTVRTEKGSPVADAVVMARPAAGGAVPHSFAQPLRLAQHNRMFDPFVLVVPVGAAVSFPNQDPFHHQVYSFSPAKKFELKLYSRDETRSVVFDKVGVVAVGCNIHDTMVAFIQVTDAPFAAKTDATGRAILHGLPPGAVEVRVWHPYSKAPAGEQRLSLVAPRDGGIERAVTVELRTPPLRENRY